jgi:uncharacterized protein (DUF1015 family)
MVEIRPFRAIRYTKKAGNYQNLITQPYDKINSNMQREYYEKSEYNYCRLTLPIEENRYERSKKRLNEWFSNEILKKDDKPAFFIYRQEFKLFNKTHTRTGFIAALRLHPYNENMVLPHETTHKGPKIDRLNMLKATQKNLEPGFLLYPDPKKITIKIFAKIANNKPLIDVKDSIGVRNIIWQLTDPIKINLIIKTLKDKQFVIADGHHRYETAIVYRDDIRKKDKYTDDSAFNFRMSYLVPIQDEGLIVLPTHRLLRKVTLTDKSIQQLKTFFTISELPVQSEEIRKFLKENKQKHAICIYDGKKAYGLLLKDEISLNKFMNPNRSDDYLSLDVVILRDIIFKRILNTGELKIEEDILYVRWIKDALEKIDKKEASLAFIVNSTTPDRVLKIAQNHERMPEKSTDFYPKMVSGFTMMDLSMGEKL